MAAAVGQFLEETELTKKPKTLAAYTTALNYFTESCRKLYLHEIERHDLLRFSSFLREEKKQSPRSTYNKFETVMTFLKANGVRGLVGKNDWPRYTEEEPEMYEREELNKLFKACTEEERLWYEFFPDDGHARTGSDVHLLVGRELRGFNGSSQPQARQELDAQGVQRARDPDSCEAGKETEGVEEELG